MKKHLYIFLLITTFMAYSQGNIVNTANGLVEGFTNVEGSVAIFKGIPFAALPLGDLRWAAPRPSKNWKGVLNCSDFSASPIQNKPEPFLCWSKEFIAQPEPLNEDCLHLNVWNS